VVKSLWRKGASTVIASIYFLILILDFQLHKVYSVFWFLNVITNLLPLILLKFHRG